MQAIISDAKKQNKVSFPLPGVQFTFLVFNQLNDLLQLLLHSIIEKRHLRTSEKIKKEKRIWLPTSAACLITVSCIVLYHKSEVGNVPRNHMVWPCQGNPRRDSKLNKSKLFFPCKRNLYEMSQMTHNSNVNFQIISQLWWRNSISHHIKGELFKCSTKLRFKREMTSDYLWLTFEW